MFRIIREVKTYYLFNMGKSPKTEHGGLSSGEAFKGLLHKALILLVVLLEIRTKVVRKSRIHHCEYSTFLVYRRNS